MTGPFPENHLSDCERFWQEFATANDIASQHYSIETLGDSAHLADKLLGLILSGQKRATTGLLKTYELENMPLPRIGQYVMLLDGHGRPGAICQTTRVAIVPMRDVDGDFARAEGEGDGSLEAWQRIHKEFFTREGRRMGFIFDPSMDVVLEQFRLVWPVKSAA